MKKLSLKILIILLLLFGFFITCVTLKADTNDVYLIMTNPSSDCSTEMNITWHSTIPGTFVEYTTKEDTAFSNKNTALPIEEELEIYDGTSGDQVKDYKCEVTLKGLTPDTEYIYRVGLTNKSSINHFKTAGSNNFSFAVVSDIHTYSKIATRLSKANSIIHSMEKTTVPSFILSVGDMMAYGTNRGYWDDFTKSDMAKNYMIAATPGNHDYYNSSANFLDASYFNAYTNNPDNGSEMSFNTTYYFYYGDVLFISLNSEDACTNSNAKANQREWLNKVLSENEEALYKVVYFHRSMYPGSGSNTGHASTMKGAFQDLIDKYGVDLVFGGHDHVYVRTTKILNGKESQDSSFGTTYVSLPQIGDRASAAGSDMTNVLKKIGGISGAVLVTVDENSMQFSLYDDGGNILDNGSITNKMKSIQKTKVNNGTKIKYTDDFSNMFLTIPDILFQRAYNVKVIDKSNNQELLSIRPSYGITEYRIMGISKFIKEKEFEVIISYRNGTTYSKSITVKNDLNYGVLNNIRIEDNKLVWDSNLDSDIVQEIRIIEDGNTFTYPIDTKSHEIKLPLLKVSEIKLQLVAIDDSIVDEFIIPYGINPNDVVFAVPELEVNVGEEVKIEIVNSLGIHIDYTYKFDSDYIEQKDGKFYAIKEGTTTIICSNENFSDQTVLVKINPKTKFSVTIDYNYDSPNTTKVVVNYVESLNDISYLQEDALPKRDGYTLNGFYLDKECTKLVDTNNYIINGDVTLYAGWSAVEQEKTSGCNKGTIINYLISLSMVFGVVFVIKKKH